MRFHCLASILALGALMGCATSCRKDRGLERRDPVREMEWKGGFSNYGQTMNGFFGKSVRTDLLEIWKWDGTTVKKEQPVKMPVLLDLILLPDNRYLACAKRVDRAPWPLVLASLPSNEVTKKWEPPAGWGYRHAGFSRNRKFAAVMLMQDYCKPPPGYDWKNPRFRIGLMDISSKELRWVAKLVGDKHLAIGEIAVSDDGKYIAIAGWDNCVALVDSSAQKVLWVKRPPEICSPDFVVFSSDGLRLYTGDPGSGCVYAVETRTGKVTRRLYATETGKPIYGHRISCLALSPDELWLAAGTGPEGLVFLFNVKSNEKPVILPHGRITTLLVSFSPDSKYLASVAGGMIKIWSVTNNLVKQAATGKAE